MKRIIRSLIAGALLATLIPAMASAAVTTVDCLDGNGDPSGSFTIEDNVVTGSDSCAGTAAIPAGVTSIGVFAFANSTTLETVTVPSSVTLIDYGAFQGTTNLVSVTLAEGLNVIRYYAFANSTALTSISIPNTVTLIDNYAFVGATSLTSIVLPDSVTSLGNGVFKDTTALSSVTLSNNLTSIPTSTFQNATSLQSITIPGSVTSIGMDAFRGASSLSSVNFSEGLITIGNGAFGSATSLLSITIPNTVTTIEAGAFFNNTSLASVTIPNSVTSIGQSAFFNDSALTSITIPDSVISLGGYAFFNATGLISIILSENLTAIEDNTFRNATSLQSITIPNSVTSIGDHAFRDATSLTSITIPSSVTSIGMDAFSSTPSLSSFYFLGAVPEIVSWESFQNVGPNPVAYVTPSNLASFGVAAPGDIWNGLTVATFIPAPIEVACRDSNNVPSGSFTIEDNVITGHSDCAGSVVIPSGITSIGDNAFGASALTSISIPNTVTMIGNGAFDNASSLTSVTIPNSVISIGAGAFSYATSLTSVTIPNSVTIIGESAFRGTSSLASITLPDSVTYLGGSVFMDAIALTSITIPSGVTAIENDSFYGATALTDITLPNTLTTIGSGAFWGAISLASITIPSSVISIGNNAFRNATALTSVTIPSGVTAIGSYAFHHATSLTSVTLSENLTSIGEGAFADMLSLLSITIPAGVDTIGDYAFAGDAALAEVHFLGPVPSSVGQYAFFDLPFGAMAHVTEENSTSFALDSNGLWNGLVVSYTPTPNIPDAPTNLQVTATNPTTAQISFNYGADGSRPIETFTVTSSPDSLIGELTGTSGGEIIVQINVTGLTPGAEYTFTATATNSGGTSADSLPSASITMPVPSDNSGPTEISCSTSGSFTIEDNVVTSNTNCAGSADIPDGVTSIGNSAFFGALNLETVTMTNSVTSIGIYAFYGTSSLTNIRLSESITSIAQSTFDAASALTSIIIPEGVTSIGFIAFIGAVSLETVTLPSTLTSIGPDAFENMPLLRSITIPSGVTSIGEKAFDRDLSLADVYFLGAAPQTVGPNAFGTVAPNAKAHVTQSNLASFVLDGNGLWNGLIVETFTVPVILLVGDTGPAGGKIFITPQTAGNTTGLYFEVAPVDVSNSRYTFCNQTNQLISGTLNSGIGYGESNTAAMIDWGCTSGAGAVTSNYSFGGFSDWFLPSLDEAAELFSTQAATGVLEGADTHWTSTGFNANTSWTRYFSFDNVDNLDQTAGGGFYVRAVRSFCLECNDELSVPTVPDAPTLIGTEEINSTTVKITFDAPANSGGATIETFTVTSTPDSLVGELSSSVGGFVTISGLTPSATYTFTVTATNSVGASLASAPSDPITLSDTNGGGNTSFSCGGGGNYFVINGVFTVDWNNECSGPLVLDASVTTLEYATSFNQVTSLSIPAATTSISENFVSRSIITEYIVDSENPNFRSIDGVLYSKDGLRLISYPQSKAGLSFTLPSEVTEVISGAFHALNELQIVNITESATVSTYSFDSCCNGNTGNTLREINVDENNPNFASLDGVLFNKDFTELLFYPTDKLGTNYVVPSSVKYFTGAFNGNKNLVSIALPDGFLGMQTYEFESADNLESITIPASTTSVGQYPFYNALKLQSINVDPENLFYKSIDGVLFTKDGIELVEYPDGKTAEEFLFPSGLVTIPGQWVTGNPYLRRITIPATVQSIGGGYLPGVTHITFEGDSQISSIEGVFNNLISNVSVSYCGTSNSVLETFFADAGSYECGFPEPTPTVPDAAASVEATAIDSTTVHITFAWGPNGGPQVESFTAISDSGITGVLTAGTVGYITVTGLTPGATYTFTVTATNSVGTSAPSSPSASITMPAGSSPPTDNSSGPQTPSAEEIARALEIDRQAALLRARNELLRVITSGETLTVQHFTKAELIGVHEGNLKAVSDRMAMHNSKTKITFEVVTAVVHEFKIVGDIAAKTRTIFSSDLISIGLITKAERYKTAILKALKALSTERLSTYEKIGAEIKSVQAIFEARAKKLQSTLKR